LQKLFSMLDLSFGIPSDALIDHKQIQKEKREILQENVEGLKLRHAQLIGAINEDT